MQIGFNDNRMYLADLISQPDHTMATIIGIEITETVKELMVAILFMDSSGLI